jgi:hypothetical protein
MAAQDPTLPLWAVQRVGSIWGYAGRDAHEVARAALAHTGRGHSSSHIYARLSPRFVNPVTAANRANRETINRAVGRTPAAHCWRSASPFRSRSWANGPPRAADALLGLPSAIQSIHAGPSPDASFLQIETSGFIAIAAMGANAHARHRYRNQWYIHRVSFEPRCRRCFFIAWSGWPRSRTRRPSGLLLWLARKRAGRLAFFDWSYVEPSAGTHRSGSAGHFLWRVNANLWLKITGGRRIVVPQCALSM